MKIKFYQDKNGVVAEIESDPERTWEYLYTEYFANSKDKDFELHMPNIYRAKVRDVKDVELSDDDNSLFRFVFATAKDSNYYKIIGIGGLDNINLFFNKDIELNEKFFRTKVKPRIGIWGVISGITISKNIYIGGDQDGAIPWSVFESLFKTFPTNTEIEQYIDRRVTQQLDQFIQWKDSYESRFSDGVKRRIAKGKYKSDTYPELTKSLAESKELKRSYLENVKRSFELWLQDKEKLDEVEWEKKITDIIPLIFPNYINVKTEIVVNINDRIQQGKKTKKNKIRLDYALLKADNSIDLLEMKIPDTKIMNKSTYRDNYIPSSALSGAIVQVQKYIYTLDRAGIEGEKIFEEAFQEESVYIRNPKALILIGRSQNLTESEKRDFTIFKQRYIDIADILTYDDILSRLDQQINAIY